MRRVKVTKFESTFLKNLSWPGGVTRYPLLAFIESQNYFIEVGI